MTISNVLASVAVKDIKAAVLWYEKVIGRLEIKHAPTRPARKRSTTQEIQHAQ